MSISADEHHHSHEKPELDSLLGTDCRAFLTRVQERQHQSDGGHDHDHDAPKAEWRLWTMIILTGVFFLAELVTGIITGSLALQSDAFHMFTDEASLIIGLIAHKKAKGGPTKKMSFGWGRAQVIGGLSNSVFLLAICLTILIEAIMRFVVMEEITNVNLLLIVGGLGLLINIIGIFIFHDHGHNDNLEGVFLHIFGDALGSIGVMISALVVKFATGDWRFYLDPAISLVIVCLLVMGAVRLFVKTSSTVMESTPSSIDTDEIANAMTNIPGLVSVHELHVWQLNNDNYLALAHIIIDKKEHHQEVQTAVHNMMLEFGVYSTTVQVEYINDYPEGTNPELICSFSASFGASKRAFFTPGLYKHCIGCPHQHQSVDNALAYEETQAHDEHHHDHDHEKDHTHDLTPADDHNSLERAHSDHTDDTAPHIEV